MVVGRLLTCSVVVGVVTWLGLAVVISSSQQAGSDYQRTIEAALAVAHGIGDPSRRALALADVGVARLQASDGSGASETFAAAHAQVESIPNTSDRLDALLQIAAGRMNLGDGSGLYIFDEVHAAATAIPDPALRARTLATVAASRSRSGDVIGGADTFIDAVDAAFTIDGSISRYDTLIQIVGFQLEAARYQLGSGNLDGARETLTGALEAANGIDEPGFRGIQLSAVASVYLVAGMTERAEELFGEAILAAERSDRSDLRATALAFVAHDLAPGGRSDIFDDVIEKANDAVGDVDQKFRRGELRARIATAMHEVGDTRRARELFEDARNDASDDGGGFWRALGQEVIAGVRDGAREAFSSEDSTESGLVAATMRDAVAGRAEVRSPWATLRVAVAEARAGYANDALRTIDEIERDILVRGLALVEVASVHAEARRLAPALAILRRIAADGRIRDVADAAELTEYLNARVHAAVGPAQWRAGNVAGARSSLAQVGTGPLRDRTLHALIEEATEVDRPAASLTALHDLAVGMEDDSLRSDAMVRVATAFAAAGDFDAALTAAASVDYLDSPRTLATIAMHLETGAGKLSPAGLAALNEMVAGAVAAVPAPAPDVPGEPDREVFQDCDRSYCPEMAVVPTGQFTMGSGRRERGVYNDEKPTRTVMVSRFAIGRYEVTRSQYRAFASNTGRPWDGGCGGLDRNGVRQGGDSPALCVSWDDAQAYVTWLRLETGASYRLPSEAEWEYAARAGTTTKRFWGNDVADQCLHGNGSDVSRVRARAGGVWDDDDLISAPCSDNAVYTAPVGSYQPNAFGLYDMLGNASEWTQDCWHGNHDDAPRLGGAWMDEDACRNHVTKGGDWSTPTKGIRSAFRMRTGHDDRGPFVGFRVAKTLGE